MQIMFQCNNFSDDNIQHAFFSRKGGVSYGTYESLNCGPGSQDNPTAVIKNRTLALRQLAPTATALVTLHQCHSNNVQQITDENFNFVHEEVGDALVTTVPEIAIGVLTADCAPILLADTEAGVIGAAHAGWRGAMVGIVENTIKKMISCGAAANNIKACIGPCIGSKSYRVQEDMFQKFIGDNEGNKQFFDKQEDASYMFDLRGYIVEQIGRTGVSQISHVNQDTYAQPENFFSYRYNRENGSTEYGRQLSAIALKA